MTRGLHRLICIGALQTAVLAVVVCPHSASAQLLSGSPQFFGYFQNTLAYFDNTKKHPADYTHNYRSIARYQNCPAMNRGDVNCDGKLDRIDLAYLNAYLMNSGPAPCNPCECNPYPTGCIPQ